MLLLMVRRSYARGWKSKLLAAITIALGVSMTAAMLNIALDVSDKVAKELRAYGANLIVQPQTPEVLPRTVELGQEPLAHTTFLNEADLTKIKQIFWRNNIVAFTPLLNSQGDIGQHTVPLIGVWFNKKLAIAPERTIKTGIKATRPWLKIEGRHPNDSAAEALIGRRVAERLGVKPGDRINVMVAGEQLTLKIAGVMTSGDQLDEEVLLPIALLQEKTGLPGKISQAEVSTLTTPENALAEKYSRDPESLTAAEWEQWYCTPFIDSIAFQIEEVVPGANVSVVRQVAQSEGLVLQKTQLLMALLAIAALASTALAISSLMTAMALERSREIGLAKALGGADWLIAAGFLAESAVLGLIGGLVGFGLGMAFTKVVTQAVFGSPIALKPLVFPLTLALALLVALGGSLAAVRAIIRLDPKAALHG